MLLRNKEVFRYWRRLGLEYMFIGVEAVDQEALELHRKRVKLSTNFEALEFARSLGMMVAINIIADTDWDVDRFRAIREWALSVPEIVNISVNTPYPGTETFLEQGRNLATRDYRLFDIQHAVLPTRLPLDKFYAGAGAHPAGAEHQAPGLVGAQGHGGAGGASCSRAGQTNFVRMLWKWNSVFNPERQLADHRRPVRYHMRLPEAGVQPKDLYVLKPPPRKAGAAVVDAREKRRTRGGTVAPPLPLRRRLSDYRPSNVAAPSASRRPTSSRQRVLIATVGPSLPAPRANDLMPHTRQNRWWIAWWLNW